MDFKKKNIQQFLRFIPNIIILPIFFILFILKHKCKIQFVRLRVDRIGHLVANTEIFLRRINLGLIDNKIKYVGIATMPCSNNVLLNMYKKTFPIIIISNFMFYNLIFKYFSSKYSILNKLILYYELECESNEYFEWDNNLVNLKFTKSQENEGISLLKKLGIEEKDYFVCIHARDSVYLTSNKKNDCSYHHYRDADINTYLRACEYITEQNGYIIRMGAIVEKPFITKNKKIIDYAKTYRTEFGDVYLSAKCKFFLGSASGISQISQSFNVPQIWVNFLPIEAPPWSHRDLFIPKKLWSEDKKRFLSIREIIELGLHKIYVSEEYINKKVRWVDNSPEEIFDVTKEMYERLNGSWKSTEEDELLQKKYKSFFDKNTHCYGFPSHIGAKFLRENTWLLD